MLRPVIDFGKKIFTLSSRAEKLEEKVAALTTEVLRLSDSVTEIYPIR